MLIQWFSGYVKKDGPGNSITEERDNAEGEGK